MSPKVFEWMNVLGGFYDVARWLLGRPNFGPLQAKMTDTVISQPVTRMIL